MSGESKRKIFSGSISGIIAKVLDASAKLFTIPILIGYYGKADFGLITLAISLNAYLRVMDLGMNTGAIRFFSIWFAKGENNKIIKGSQSSFVFYGLIGCLNALLLAVLGIWAEHIFNVEAHQLQTLKWMMYMLSASAILYWASYVVNQLLIAYGELTWTNYGLMLSSILNLLTVYISIYFKLSLPIYFLLFILSTIVVIPFNIYRLKIIPLKSYLIFLPRWDYSVFKEILNYSLGIFFIGLFHYSVDGLRPVILGIFSIEGTTVLTDYRVMNSVVMLVGAIGAVFLQVLLPEASKSYASGDKKKIAQIVFTGTKYISLFLSFLIFLIILNVKSFLLIYMGEEYVRLWKWLTVWLLLMLYMHDFAISSLILSMGKTKALIYAAGIGALFSLTATTILVPYYEVGATIIGYSIFIIIQMGFNYFYYLPYVIKLDSKKIFLKSFMPSVLIGLFAAFVGYQLNISINFQNPYVDIIIGSSVYFVIFSILTLVFVIKPYVFINMIKSILK